MAEFMAQAFSAAGVGSRPAAKHTGPKPVDQRRIADADPFTGDWSRFQSWFTNLRNELESADAQWADVLDRLEKWEPHSVKDSDLDIIIGSGERNVQLAFQNELYRVVKDRCKGIQRDALVAQQPKRSFDTLKQWLRQGQDRGVAGQR